MAGFGVLALIIALLVFLFWIWMIIDCVQRGFRNQGEKIIWIVVIALLGWLGALLYLIIVKNMNPRGLSGESSGRQRRK